MAAAIAHEVKNPLAGIEVMAGLLRRKIPDNPDAQAVLTDIISEAKMANAIVQEVLEFVRPIRLQVEHTGVAEALDAHLWTYRDDSFLPHAIWRDGAGGAGDAQDQPIVLAVEEGNPNGANVRFLIDNAALPADAAAYERMVLVFNGDDGEALAAARGAWTDCKARGFDVTYWQADERGRWQRRD